MNCKPGDIAVIIRSASTPQAVGRLVNVQYLATETHWQVELIGSAIPVLRYDWTPAGNTRHFCCSDAVLRPIRDSDAPDETLAWAGNPNHRATDRETAEDALLRRMREIAE